MEEWVKRWMMEGGVEEGWSERDGGVEGRNGE